MDVEAAVLDHHSFEHGTDELSPGVEVKRGERTADTIDRGLQVSWSCACCWAVFRSACSTSMLPLT